METVFPLLIGFLFTPILVRLLTRTVRSLTGLLAACLCGFCFLWLLNRISCLTGVQIPVNGITAMLAGTLGLPGIGLAVLLECL